MLFVFLGASAAGLVLGGLFGDRFGAKTVIWFSILGVLPFTLALPYANLFWINVLAVLIGLILSSAFSAIVVFAQELVPGRVGMIAGIFFGLAFGFGGIGAAVLGVLADYRGIDYVFWVCSFLPLLGLLTIFLPNMKRGARAVALSHGAKRQSPSQTAQGWHRLFASGTPRVRADRRSAGIARPSEEHAEIFGIRHRPRGHARPQGLGGAVVLARAAERIRRHHRRRRRAWPGDGLLSRQGARHHQCRGARKGLARRRQHRPQHHHHPLQLSLRRERRHLRPCREAVGRAQPGPQLQRHVFGARRHDAGAQCARRAGAEAPRPRQPAERHRQ